MSKDSDDLSMSLLKDVFSYISGPFTYICNLSFKCGRFPDKMKTSKVIPLFKSGDKATFSNYRPVVCLAVYFRLLCPYTKW